MSISKRIISIFLLAFFALSLCSCDGRRKYTSNSFEYFDTVTTVTGYAETQAEFNSVCEKVYSLLEEYHKLYNIYYTYEGLNNLKTVNQTQGPVKVDEKILALYWARSEDAICESNAHAHGRLYKRGYGKRAFHLARIS